MQTSRKAKTPTSANVEVQSLIPQQRGIKFMKNDITLVNKSQLTMSSREIAELTNKEHKNVLRVIRDLISAQVLDAQIEPLKFEYRNQWFDYYELNKRDSLVTVARLSPEFMAFVVDRWQELEQQASNNQIKLPTTKELALMVIQAEEENERLMIENKTLGSQLEEMKPTVAAFDRIATKAEGSMCVTDAAKHLQVQPRKFFQELNSMGWIYKRTGSHYWLGYQDKVKQGLLEHKITTVSRSDGSEKIVEQVLITPKGLAKLSQLLSQKIAA
jgi:phage antirepressor YoqD-like protein